MSEPLQYKVSVVLALISRHWQGPQLVLYYLKSGVGRAVKVELGFQKLSIQSVL